MPAKRAARFLVVFLIYGAVAVGAEKVVYQADFSGSGGLSDQGWEILSTAAQSEYEARDGVLRVTCKKNWHNGGLMRRPVPLCRKGMLEFDACVPMEQGGSALGVCLTVGVYNISTWFHD